MYDLSTNVTDPRLRQLQYYGVCQGVNDVASFLLHCSEWWVLCGSIVSENITRTSPLINEAVFSQYEPSLYSGDWIFLENVTPDFESSLRKEERISQALDIYFGISITATLFSLFGLLLSYCASSGKWLRF